jgi:hypothetical protein
VSDSCVDHDPPGYMSSTEILTNCVVLTSQEGFCLVKLVYS